MKASAGVVYWRPGCCSERKELSPMKRTRLLLFLLLMMASLGHVLGQSPPVTPATPATPAARPQAPPPPLVSPDVQPDGRVTFRFRDPNAHAVMLQREGAHPVPMQKDDQGVWSISTDPLEPDYYGYSFIADGVVLIDPSNYLMKPNLL